MRFHATTIFFSSPFEETADRLTTTNGESRLELSMISPIMEIILLKSRSHLDTPRQNNALTRICVDR